MGKNIYTLLNQVETDLGEYEIEEIETTELEESAKRILGKLNKDNTQSGRTENNMRRPVTKRQVIRKLLRTAAIITVCILSIGGVGYAATDGELFDYVYAFISGGGIYEKTDLDSGANVSTVVFPMGGESGVVLLFEDGRLYFIGDGGKTDITDEISETEPYFIDVRDEVGFTHKFNIGGRAEEGCYGYNEMIIDDKGEFRGAYGIYGEKINLEAGEMMPEWDKKGTEEVRGMKMPD